MKITLHRAVVYTMKPAFVTSIKQYLVLCDLNFYFPFLCTSLNLIKLVLSNHLSYMTLFQCSLGRSGQKKIMCVYCHMLKKIQGWSVGIIIIFFFYYYYRQNRKQWFPVPESESGISISKFPVSRHLLKLFYDELCNFSTFFAFNFDKQLAVE